MLCGQAATPPLPNANKKMKKKNSQYMIITWFCGFQAVSDSALGTTALDYLPTGQVRGEMS